MRRVFGFLRWLIGLRGPDEPVDGFGQSFIDDLRFLARLRRYRRLAVRWEAPSWQEERDWDDHPIVGRFGDMTIATALIAGRRCVLRDRDWFGWPDPPRYAVFILDGQDIWAAGDMNVLPPCWTVPPSP